MPQDLSVPQAIPSYAAGVPSGQLAHAMRHVLGWFGKPFLVKRLTRLTLQLFW